MKLLFDENLSSRLVPLLEGLFPGSESVLTSGLGGKPDEEIWTYAHDRGLVVVTKDLDFAERAISSPSVKVIWIRLGNCTTEAVNLVLHNFGPRIAEFEKSNDVLLELP